VPVSPPESVKVLQAGASKVKEKDALKYVWIRPGTFTMGCSVGDAECSDNEKPAHEVTITKGFWMGQTVVTVGAYRRYTQATGRPMPSEKDFTGKPQNAAAANDSLPVVEVNWTEAIDYCAWARMRLPSEAEWEYAARAGSTAARYGNLDEIAWYADNSGHRRIDSTALHRADPSNYIQQLADNGNGQKPVGQKQPNAFGLYDMLGNVLQWTADWYGNYAATENHDPSGPPGGTVRVIRGSPWFRMPSFARVSAREGTFGPEFRNPLLGFRCAGN